MTRFFRRFLVLSALLVLLHPLVATADHAGWNELGRQPGYGQGGLLRIDSLYFDMAAATGGDFYFWAPGEFASVAGQLNVPLASEPIALAYSNRGGDFTRSLDIPVDGTISRLSLFAGAQRLDDLGLLMPDGRAPEADAAGVTVQEFRHMRIITVVNPEPGLWQVTMSGSGGYELAARCLADQTRLREQGLRSIELIGFDFVALGGRPGHQGYFPVSGAPRAGTEQLCRVTVSGGIVTPTIELVSGAGALLGKVFLEKSEDVASDEFLGRCRLPDQPFRVLVRGTGRQGWVFQRVTSGVITPGAP